MSSSESLPQNAEQEDVSDGKTDENTEQVETDSVQNYQIRPKLEDKFKPLAAKEVIHNVLYDVLSSKEYELEKAKKWAKEISSIVLAKLKTLQFSGYKYVVDVVIGPRNGAGVKSSARCIWDTESDSLAYDNFTNDSLFCLATVYAIYTY